MNAITPLKQLKNIQGQVTIFLGLSLLIIITLMAFMVNVGLFVKAKINLQNAVDAAAYAGASVQARQLTDIAYLNWEMRNNYKEWLFKYYILGEYSIVGGGKLPSPTRGVTVSANPNTVLDFRMKPMPSSNFRDKFNVPSICFHPGGTKNICEMSAVPGLPRFDSQGIPGLDQKHESIVNSFVKAKSDDCAKRTAMNFMVAMNWAYGTGKTDTNANTVLTQNLPQVLLDRMGVWPKAFELAVRIRNLEMIVNTMPQSQGITKDSVEALDQSDSANGNLPIHERPIKAFWSAYRNLGGGDNKFDRDLKANFTLYEIPPTPYTAEDNTLSSLLIPTGEARNKYYLDLQLIPMNYVSFFTFFAQTTEIDNSNIGNEGACAGSKVGIPVPSLFMGYQKNHKLLTYYAVKGKAKFVGLFNPFAFQSGGIEMEAVAAAKPFGGRIGPNLFLVNNENTGVKARTDQNSRTSAYSIGFTITNRNPFQAGDPLPKDANFWVNQAKIASDVTLGGTPTSGSEIVFSVPNLIYDFENYSDINHMRGTANRIIDIKEDVTANSAVAFGLYDAKQYKLFLQNALNHNNNLGLGLLSARGPTLYESLNYLIPTPDLEGGFESVPTISSVSRTDVKNDRLYTSAIMAPLYGPGTLYQTPNEFTSTMHSILASNSVAIDKYLSALYQASEAIRQTGSRSGDAYQDAAKVIFEGATPTTPAGCSSLASKFASYLGRGSCSSIKPMPDVLSEIFYDYGGKTPRGDLFYVFEYYLKNGMGPRLLSAYRPGTRQGATSQGVMQLSSESYSMARNSYSTKFIPIKLLGDGGQSYLDKPLYIEPQGGMGTAVSDHENSEFKNPISLGEIKQELLNF